MNIHQLLSVSQSSPQTQSQGAFSRQDSANGLFHQTLLQASDAHRLSASMLSETNAPQAPLHQAQLDTRGSLLPAALQVDAENLGAALEALGLDVSESDLSELLAQLQLPNSDISADTLGLNGGQVSTPLGEIAGRLALMASFTDDSTSLTAEQLTNSASLQLTAKQLDISPNEPASPIDPSALEAIAGRLALMTSFSEGSASLTAEQLINSDSLQLIAKQLDISPNEPASPINPSALEAIADQLNISQGEASQLADIPALKTFIQSLGMDKSRSMQSIDPAALKAIAEQLDINHTEAAQLADIPALKTLIKSLSMDENRPVQSIDPAVLEAIADQLNISQTEAAQLADLPALKTIIQSLSTDQISIDKSRPVQSIDPAALKAIVDQLNINQTEAVQLVSALNVVVGQQYSTQTLAVDSARLTDARPPVVELQTAPRAQPDNFVALINTATASTSPQISGEALMGALLAAEGSAKGNSAGEHLLSGLALSTGSPAASSQSAQPFASTVTPTAATIATPVTSPAWSQQLGQQLVQISQRGGEQHVQMQLNPAELGPLSISLKFSEQGAQAHFLSAHAQVRQVLEQAIPQLREALAEQGISLGETSVGEQRDPNDQAFAQSSGKQGIRAGGDNGEIGSDDAPPQNAGSGSLTLDGRVDLYA